MPGKNKPLTFIDLFAGIGGFHIGFDEATKGKAKCVFVSEWDKAARETYKHNFSKRPGNSHIFKEELDENGNAFSPLFAGDITKITEKLDANPDLIPDFDIMCGGFPCQPFSNAGLRKGLEETRGTLFFDMLKILQVKKQQGTPAKGFFLENVRGLKNHISGSKKTLSIIEKLLRKEGYSFHLFEVWASDHGVPQHRPRLFMIGFLKELPDGYPNAEEILSVTRKADEAFKADSEGYKHSKTPMHKIEPSLAEILGGKSVDSGREIGYTLRVGGRGSGLNDRRNWDTYEVDGRTVRLEPMQGLKMQGFPSWYEFPESVVKSQAMKQVGNSVAVPAIRYFAQKIARSLGVI
jgi:DNA (cytosine-5)-methyltransferase 1